MRHQWYRPAALKCVLIIAFELATHLVDSLQFIKLKFQGTLSTTYSILQNLVSNTDNTESLTITLAKKNMYTDLPKTIKVLSLQSPALSINLTRQHQHDYKHYSTPCGGVLRLAENADDFAGSMSYSSQVQTCQSELLAQCTNQDSDV